MQMLLWFVFARIRGTLFIANYMPEEVNFFQARASFLLYDKVIGRALPATAPALELFVRNATTGRRAWSMKFFERVFAVVATIPPGKVMTYGQISQVLDNACSARYVGYAMGAAPAGRGLPCHRVVNRLGETAPHLFNGRQRELLEAEGAVFKADGRLDLEACRYWPDGFEQRDERFLLEEWLDEDSA